MKYMIPKLENMSDECFAVCGSGSGAAGTMGLEFGGGAICQNGSNGQHNGEGCTGGSHDEGIGWDIYCHTGNGNYGCVAGTWDSTEAKCVAGSGAAP